MSNRKEQRQAEALQVTGERWQGANDQRAVPDAAPRRTTDLAPAGADAGKPTLNRHIDTERDG